MRAHVVESLTDVQRRVAARGGPRPRRPTPAVVGRRRPTCGCEPERRRERMTRSARTDRPDARCSTRRPARSSPSKNVNARIHDGEFVCILGHSGCGKSTVLSIIAGLSGRRSAAWSSTARRSTSPGAERAVVFQSPCLLPWLTARETWRWRCSSAAARRRRERRRGADALPRPRRRRRRAPISCRRSCRSARSSACRSRARLSLEPRFLLLDEPFSMLDSLTRFELQDTLLRVWEQSSARPWSW